MCPSYNYGQFIGDAVSSVLDQSVDVRMLIQDGLSNDETLDVLASYSDERVDVVSEADSGQSDALNRALARTAADVVGWLNADEFYLPGALQTVEHAFETDPSVDLVYGDVLFVDARGRLQRLLAQPDWSPFILRHRGCYISTCASFVRADALAGFTFDESLRIVMDWDYFLYLSSRANRVRHLRRPLAAFRAHDERVTATKVSRLSDEHLRVRNRYGIETRLGIAGPWVGDVSHRYKKLVSGARRREALTASFAGTSLNWTGERRSTAPLAAIIRSASGNS
jgi:glycosyltransferase involved in cell wall biosynthesis